MDRNWTQTNPTGNLLTERLLTPPPYYYWRNPYPNFTNRWIMPSPNRGEMLILDFSSRSDSKWVLAVGNKEEKKKHFRCGAVTPPPPGACARLYEHPYILPDASEPWESSTAYGICHWWNNKKKKLFVQFQGKSFRSIQSRSGISSFHFGSNEHHIVGMNQQFPISHPQWAIADGLLMAEIDFPMKKKKKKKKKKKVTLVFSLGRMVASSEGDSWGSWMSLPKFGSFLWFSWWRQRLRTHLARFFPPPSEKKQFRV